MRWVSVGAFFFFGLMLATSPSVQGQTDELGFELRLDQFRVVNADEDGPLSDGDEPYLWVLFFKVDGTTVDPTRLAEARASFYSPHSHYGIGSHGNLGGRSRRRGASVPISERLGLYSDRLRLIRELPVDFARLATQAGVIVLALEEDGSSGSAVEAGRREFERAVAEEINAVVRSPLNPRDYGEIAARIQERVVRAIRERTLRGWTNLFRFLTGIADPDDFIGANMGTVHYGQLLERAEVGPFTMRFEKPGVHYQVTWTARRR